MKKIIIALALVSFLPAMATAEKKASAPAKAMPKEHHMQNTNPAPKAATEPAPEHVMNNASPTAKPEQEKAPEHSMQNN